MLQINDLEGRGQNLPEATHPEASNSSHLGHIFLPAESGPVGRTWHRCCRVLLLGPCPPALEGHQPHSSVPERRFPSLVASGLRWAAVEAEQSLEGEQAVCACLFCERPHSPHHRRPFPAGFLLGSVVSGLVMAVRKARSPVTQSCSSIPSPQVGHLLLPRP